MSLPEYLDTVLAIFQNESSLELDFQYELCLGRLQAFLEYLKHPRRDLSRGRKMPQNPFSVFSSVHHLN